jgi:hypothetical protein
MYIDSKKVEPNKITNNMTEFDATGFNEILL